MLTLSPSFYRNTQPFLFRIWVFNHLRKFAFRLEKKLVDDFDKFSSILEKDFAGYNDLSTDVASKELTRLKRLIKPIESLDHSISENGSYVIKSSFSGFKKNLYKCEARLHKIAYANNEIIPTSDAVKKGLSNLGLKSVSTQISQ